MIDIIANKVLGPAILKGEAIILRTLLEERFGALPEETEKLIERSSNDDMVRWTKRAVRVQTLSEVFQ